MWTQLKDRWRRYCEQKLAKQVDEWRAQWCVHLWDPFKDYGYALEANRSVKPHVAAIALPSFKKVVFHPTLPIDQRRLACATILMAMKRSAQGGGFSRAYLLKRSDLKLPEGPEDNLQWQDFINGLEHLAPVTHVDEIKRRFPQQAPELIAKIFDVSRDAARQRIQASKMLADFQKRNADSPA